MGKVILKTALVTLGSLLAAALILVAALTMFTPRTMSMVFDELGGERISLWYIELSYQKSGSTEDLTDLFVKSVSAGDDGRTAKYGKELGEREDFAAICEEEDGRVQDQDLPFETSFASYVYGNTAAAIRAAEGAAAAVAYAAEKTPADYPPDNPFQILLYSEGAESDAELLALLAPAIAGFDGERAAADLEYLQSLLQH